MYSYHDASNFYNSPTMSGHSIDLVERTSPSQIQFCSNYENLSENQYYLVRPNANRDCELPKISAYSPPYQNSDQTYDMPQPSMIMTPVEIHGNFSNGNICGNQNNSYQCTSVYSAPGMKPHFHQPQPYHNNIMAKKHRAQITLVPSSTGSFKAIVKRKRKRTTFTTEQVAALEQIFSKKPYITREDRQVLVQQLQINDKAIKIWFQNRRLKGKRVTEEEDTQEDPQIKEPVSEERITPDISRLDYVQSQIIQKTDEFGYVMLDDRVLGDLAAVIDNLLTNDRGVPSDKTIDESNPIYEPISPASVSGESHMEETSSWEPTEPNESLQRLFDLQTMLSL